MATAVTPYNPAFRWNVSAQPQAYVDRLVLTSATWKAGQFLKLPSGLLAPSTTGAASGVGADAIQYYALTTLASALGASTYYRTVGIVHEDDVWEMCVYNTGTIDTTQNDLKYDMNVTSNVCTVNTGSSSHAVFKVVNSLWKVIPFANASTVTGARVLVKVLQAAIHATAA